MKHDWHFMHVAEIGWKRLGLGVELSLGAWYPREFSIYLHVGPLLLGVGIEHEPYPEWRSRAAQKEEA